MPTCNIPNIPQAVCDLQEAVEGIIVGSGHPPLSVAFSTVAPDSFDQPTQSLVINNAPVVIPNNGMKTFANDAAKLASTPDYVGQLAVQINDAPNGNYTLWAAYAIAPGAWTQKTSTLAYQNQNNVVITGGTISGISDLAIADGGTGASTKQAARVNLMLPTVASGVNVDWFASGLHTASMSGDTDFFHVNIFDGAIIRVLIKTNGFQASWPDVTWLGGSEPVSSANSDLYTFVKFGTAVLGSAQLNFTPVVYPQ